MKLFGRTTLLPQQSLTPTNLDAITGTEEVLAAANRVHKKFGLATEADKLAAAIATAQNKNEVAKAFADANIGILDTNEVLKYQAKRIRSTWREHLKSWHKTVYDFLIKHGLGGDISETLSFFVTVPSVVFYAIGYFDWEVSLLPGQIENLIIFGGLFNIFHLSLWMIIRNTIFRNERNDFVERSNFLYSHIHVYAILIPVFLTGFIFHRCSLVKKWSSVPIKKYEKTISNEVALKIDQIMTVLPNAKLELQVLKPAQDDKDEFFLTLPLGKTGDKLHLWHEAA